MCSIREVYKTTHIANTSNIKEERKPPNEWKSFTYEGFTSVLPCVFESNSLTDFFFCCSNRMGIVLKAFHYVVMCYVFFFYFALPLTRYKSTENDWNYIELEFIYRIHKRINRCCCRKRFSLYFLSFSFCSMLLLWKPFVRYRFFFYFTHNIWNTMFRFETTLCVIPISKHNHKYIWKEYYRYVNRETFTIVSHFFLFFYLFVWNGWKLLYNIHIIYRYTA